MAGLEVVDVEISIGVPSAPDVLGVYLHHPDEDGRVEAETKGYAAGAEYTTYPIGPVPPVLENAYVQIKGVNMYVAIGPMYVIAPLLAKREEVAHLEEAIVYFATEPYSEITADEISSGSSGSNSSAASPVTSGIAPAREATTGTLAAMASRTGSPNPS